MAQCDTRKLTHSSSSYTLHPGHCGLSVQSVVWDVAAYFSQHTVSVRINHFYWQTINIHEKIFVTGWW